MKVSLITVTYNASDHVRDCIESVLSQTHSDLEYIVIDGASSDNTMEIIREYSDRISHLISEPDDGLYDAMNKGIALATGDIVGILNADDLYSHKGVISKVVDVFNITDCDATFGDLVYFKTEEPDKITRFFPGKGFHPRQFAKGIMPPHPTFFVKRSLYESFGRFDTQFDICADFDLMVRFLYQNHATYTYIPEVLVRMRTGGSSTQGIQSTLTINKEMLRSCKQNGIATSLPKIYSKYFKKVFQLVKKPG